MACNNRNILMAVLFFGVNCPSFAQDDREELLLHHIESLLEETDGMEADHVSLSAQLEWLHAHPVNLNRATRADFRQLFMLNDIQIYNLLQHIRDHGRLVSIYELQTIEGFDMQTIRSILPFVTVDTREDTRHFRLENMLSDGEHVFFVRYQRLLEEQKGFSPVGPDDDADNPDSRYQGSPYRLYTRYRYTYYRNISLGFTAEKDPGEEFFRGSQPQGFDFYSAHLHLRDLGRLKAFSAGDFQVQFGQGLCLWTGLTFGKSSEAIGIKKNGQGLRQYTSVDENNFMRGLGATVALGQFEITTFYSGKRRDANIIQSDSTEEGVPVISSLQQSGLHRTPRELEGKNAVKERIIGGNITYQGEQVTIGLTAYQMKLEADFRRNLSFYNQFDLSSNQSVCVSLDYNYVARNINFFGETAMSGNGRMALLHGLMAGLHPKVSLAMAHRRYDKAYQAPFSAAFGENTRVQNEEGLYVGVAIRPSSGLRLYFFADHFRFPWMKFRVHMPGQGSDYLVNIHYRPTRDVELIARYRRKSKPLNTNEQAVIRHTDHATRTQYRLHVGFPFTPSLSMRNRLEVIRYHHGENKQKGYMLYTDILYRNLNSPFALTMRYALFGTCGFDSRIYAYEHDVLYAFSFPFYSDKGFRTYLLARYRVHRQIDLYVRLAQTLYTNRDSVGSGLDLIEGNTRTEVKVQVRLRF